jgi:hypothetical protein
VVRGADFRLPGHYALLTKDFAGRIAIVDTQERHRLAELSQDKDEREWLRARKHRMTGTKVAALPRNPGANAVKDILWPKVVKNKAVAYGKKKEKDAVKAFTAYLVARGWRAEKWYHEQQHPGEDLQVLERSGRGGVGWVTHSGLTLHHRATDSGPCMEGFGWAGKLGCGRCV